MAKYIELESALQSACKGCNIEFDDQPCEPCDCYIRKKLLAVPTIDAVPVVRCRDCNQGEVDDPDFPDQYYCHAGCGWNNGDFYCAYGERKEGAENG